MKVAIYRVRDGGIVHYSPKVSLRLCAICGLLAPITFVVGWLVGALAQPDTYSLVHDQVSDLGALAADQAWIYNRIGANLTGLLVVALAYGLTRAGLPGLAGRVGVIALAVTGVGLFFDGWLRLDCRGIDPGCSNGGTSWNVVAHSIESIITVLGLVVTVFALARAFGKSERWRDLRIPTLIAGVATVVLVFGLMVPAAGLSIRLGVTLWFVWLALVSVRLLSVAREGQRPDPDLTPT